MPLKSRDAHLKWQRKIAKGKEKQGSTAATCCATYQNNHHSHRQQQQHKSNSNMSCAGSIMIIANGVGEFQTTRTTAKLQLFCSSNTPALRKKPYFHLFYTFFCAFSFFIRILSS